MNAKIIQKYKKKTIPQLIKLATKYFNAYIRERDKDNGCICEGCRGKVNQAGHFYPATYSCVRFNEDNVHGQDVHCNYYKHGNSIEYEKGLVKKIGKKRVQALHDKVGYYRSHPYKWDRFFLISIIEKYKNNEKKRSYKNI